ncbi:MAG: hypothetical protein Aurels2KO_43890 [Aureliella sp.]
MARQLFGWCQLGIGLTLVVLAISSHLRYAGKLADAFGELDTLSAAAQSEIEVGQAVLGDVGSIAQNFRQAIPLHRQTLTATRDSSMQVAKSIAAWQQELPQLRKTAGDASAVCSNLAGQLPLRIPNITLATKTVQFEVPEIETGTRTVGIPYPTAQVENGSQELSYPAGAKVKMDTWQKSLGSFAGKNLGGLSFKYPSGLDVSRKSLRLDYPKSINIGRANMEIEVPATPKVRMQKRSFDVPSEPQLSYKEVLSDEKQLLIQSAQQLQSLDGTLASSQKTLDAAHRLAADDAPRSIDATLELLKLSERQLDALCDDRIPTTMRMLEIQHQQIGSSRKTFAALRPLISVALATLALLGVAIGISGTVKLLSPSIPSRTA